MTVKIGDVVRLRSGGPEMTVDGGPYPPSRYQKIPMVDAGWFDSRGERRRGGFAVQTLEIVHPAPGFDIAQFEGLSMPAWWHIKHNTAAKVAQMHRRLRYELGLGA